MGKYAIKGSPAFDALLDQHLQRIAEAASPHSTAGILLGGYGRGEGTPYILPDGSQAPFNDYDLIVLVDTITPPLKATFKQLEKELSAELNLPVDLYPYCIKDLPRCEFSLLNYEMKYGHMVIWGAPDALAPLPNYSHDQIPLSEGTRLLLNRGKLLLDIKERLKQAAPLTDEEHLRFIKFIYKARLALGDCALLAEQNYHLSYAEKKERITTISPEWPQQNNIIQAYQEAIKLKEWGDYSPLKTLNLSSTFALERDRFLTFFSAYEAKRLKISSCPTTTTYLNTLTAQAAEGNILKNILHNLRSLQTLSPHHPRLSLYASLLELLKEQPDTPWLKRTLHAENPLQRFYQLQQRFS